MEVCSNGPGHMINMTIMPIQGYRVKTFKNLLQNQETTLWPWKWSAKVCVYGGWGGGGWGWGVGGGGWNNNNNRPMALKFGNLASGTHILSGLLK